LLGALLFGGVLAAVWARSRPARRVAAAVALGALAATVASWVVSAMQPGAAPYTLRVIAPQQNSAVGNPVVVTVCGVYADGTRVPATDAHHYVILFVDGAEVATVARARSVYTLSMGTHTIKAELVTSSHQAFDPAQIAEVTLRVQPDAPANAAETPSRC
jgi:hypothetical protein